MSKPNYFNPKDKTAGRLGHLKDLDQKLSAFVDAFAGPPIKSQPLNSIAESDRSPLRVRPAIVTNGCWGVLFGFAVRMEYSLRNPARGIEKAQ
jgi:hypothetical protein